MNPANDREMQQQPKVGKNAKTTNESNDGFNSKADDIR